MKKAYYLFNPGVLERKDNTLKFTPYEVNDNGEFLQPCQPRYLPVEDVGELYSFGSLRANSALFNFLGQKDIKAAIQKTIAENAELHKQVDEFMKERVKMLKERLYSTSIMIGDIAVLKLVGQFPPEIVKGLALSIKGDKQPKVAFVAATHHNDKPMLTIALSDDLVKEGKNAGMIIREAAKLIQGGGGGQPGFAQAGGKNAGGLDAALNNIIEILA